MTITRQEVAANRDKWIARLLDPASKKATGVLERIGGGMCCLGHGCFALGVDRSAGVGGVVEYEGRRSYPPQSFIKSVALWWNNGRPRGNTKFVDSYGYMHDTLSHWNDYSDVTPQEIGAYLKSVKEGGPDTPFRPLSDYPDANSSAGAEDLRNV